MQARRKATDRISIIKNLVQLIYSQYTKKIIGKICNYAYFGYSHISWKSFVSLRKKKSDTFSNYILKGHRKVCIYGDDPCVIMIFFFLQDMEFTL